MKGAVTDIGLFSALAIALYSTGHWIGGTIAMICMLIEAKTH